LREEMRRRERANISDNDPLGSHVNVLDQAAAVFAADVEPDLRSDPLL